MPTFTPPIAPSPSTSTAHAPTVNSINYGDGYRQASARGINADRRRVTLVWSTLTHTNADTIETFFAGLGGYQNFDYQVPGQSAQLRWVCATWTRSEVSDLISAITAELTQVYDL